MSRPICVSCSGVLAAFPRLIVLAAVLGGVLAAHAADDQPAPPVALRQPYVFTDEAAVVEVPDDAGVLEFTQQTITREQGLSPARTIIATVTAHRLAVLPEGEGIHVLRFATAPPVELRFLAMNPPPPLDPVALRHALPWSGMRLLAGKPYLILAMGDAVTATGDYVGILRRLLARATGNDAITVLNKAYPGRAVDASVRAFAADAVPHRPDLGLVMYGLNDQSAGSSRTAYVEQYAWIARRLADDCLADTILLQPTPTIDVATRPEQSVEEFPAAAALRVLGYAEALRPLAVERHLPLAETFQAVWGDGGPSIPASARRLWALYPPAAERQYASLLESDGRGDTTHPNVLGHLAIARAAYAAITGQPAAPAPLLLAAVSHWTEAGLQSTLTVTNASAQPRAGHLAVFPLAEQGPLVLAGDGAYDLAPDAAASFQIDWPAVQHPADLLRYPASETLAAGEAIIPVVDFSADTSHVYGVPAPFAVTGGFQRERQEVYGNEVTATLVDGNRRRQRTVVLPAGADVGRIPLLEPLQAVYGERGTAVAELAFVRYALAQPGEATIDGALDEWGGSPWCVIGEPVQARWIHGPEDHREQPAECYLHWSCKAGEEALYLAIRATGKVAQDTFTIFFDPRAPAQLGTPGRYYWISGSLKDKGEVVLQRGETSTRAIGLAGAWRPTTTGVEIELRVPYDLMERRTWPVSGDLGLAIWWNHLGPLGRTQLQWSEDGYPWNPRWFGVVRRAAGTDRPLPFMVRIK